MSDREDSASCEMYLPTIRKGVAEAASLEVQQLDVMRRRGQLRRVDLGSPVLGNDGDWSLQLPLQSQQPHNICGVTRLEEKKKKKLGWGTVWETWRNCCSRDPMPLPLLHIQPTFEPLIFTSVVGRFVGVTHTHTTLLCGWMANNASLRRLLMFGGGDCEVEGLGLLQKSKSTDQLSRSCNLPHYSKPKTGKTPG